jgi:hypothetical protein
MSALPKLYEPKIHICSTLFRPNAVSPIYTILLDGELYSNVNRYLLAALQDGMTPDDLDMEPSDADEDFE